MINIKNFSTKNIFISILILILVIVIILFVYTQNKKSSEVNKREKIEEILNKDAIDVLNLNITEEQKMELIKNTDSLKSNKLSPEEARVRELEVIKNLQQ